MQGFHTNIEQETLDNTNYRKVLYTAPHSQLVLMHLKPGEEIGMETHGEHDQFIRIEAGAGEATINDETFPLKDGSALVVPAGSKHNVVNTSKTEPMKLYTIYSPPEHPEGTVQKDKPTQ